MLSITPWLTVHQDDDSLLVLAQPDFDVRFGDAVSCLAGPYWVAAVDHAPLYFFADDVLERFSCTTRGQLLARIAAASKRPIGIGEPAMLLTLVDAPVEQWEVEE